LDLIQGYPIVTVPLGTRTATGLPFGLFVRRTGNATRNLAGDDQKYSEPILYEAAFPARALPQLLEENKVKFE
jgi:hypothetical protein